MSVSSSAFTALLRNARGPGGGAPLERLDQTLARAATADRGRHLRLSADADLEDWPVLSRRELAENAHGLLVGDVPAVARKWVTTGGSTGRPVGFWLDRSISLAEWGYMTSQWQRIGYRSGDWRLVLRGRLLAGGRPGPQVSRTRREVRLSTFHLTPSTVREYVRTLASLGVPFLHAYPSSAIRLASLAQEAGLDLPRFRGLLLGSEGSSTSQREWLASSYGAPVFTWYGQSEKVLLGGECEQSRAYHLFPDYGVAEILDEEGAPVQEAGRLGRLHGTGLLNVSAPLVRYDTGDLASWGACDCGWQGQVLAEVRGRTQDVLKTGQGAEVSVAGLNLHDRSYDGLRQIQYEQGEDGAVTTRIVVGPGWSSAKSHELELALRARLPGTEVRVDVVLSIDVEPNGKVPLVKRSVG